MWGGVLTELAMKNRTHKSLCFALTLPTSIVRLRHPHWCLLYPIHCCCWFWPWSYTVNLILVSCYSNILYVSRVVTVKWCIHVYSAYEEVGATNLLYDKLIWYNKTTVKMAFSCSIVTQRSSCRMCGFRTLSQNFLPSHILLETSPSWTKHTFSWPRLQRLASLDAIEINYILYNIGKHACIRVCGLEVQKDRCIWWNWEFPFQLALCQEEGNFGKDGWPIWCRLSSIGGDLVVFKMCKLLSIFLVPTGCRSFMASWQVC